jgi:hypothetical protein
VAVVFCEIHSRSFCCAVCPHIIENKQHNKVSKHLITAEFYFGDFDGNPDYPMIYPFTYCKVCADVQGFPKADYRFSENEADESFEVFSSFFELVCGKCFDGFMEWE